MSAVPLAQAGAGGHQGCKVPPQQGSAKEAQAHLVNCLLSSCTSISQLLNSFSSFRMAACKEGQICLTSKAHRVLPFQDSSGLQHLLKAHPAPRLGALVCPWYAGPQALLLRCQQPPQLLQPIHTRLSFLCTTFPTPRADVPSGAREGSTDGCRASSLPRPAPAHRQRHCPGPCTCHPLLSLSCAHIRHFCVEKAPWRPQSRLSGFGGE